MASLSPQAMENAEEAGETTEATGGSSGESGREGRRREWRGTDGKRNCGCWIIVESYEDQSDHCLAGKEMGCIRDR